MACALKSKFIEQLGAEDGEVRSPLAGLFKSDLPLASLKDALLQITGDCPNCHPKTGSSLKIALKKAKKVQKKYNDLSLEECASIVLYTMEETPRNESIYIKMNEALRAKDRSKVRPWRDFMWLLLHGLQKLPATQISGVVRGCKKRPEEINLDLEVGDEITWSAFTSTATSVDVMNIFLGDDGPRTLLQIELTEPVARSIQDFSLFPSENEVLLPPNVCLEFVSKFNAGHGLVMMQFKQTETVDALIDMSKHAGKCAPSVHKENTPLQSVSLGETKTLVGDDIPMKPVPDLAPSPTSIASFETPEKGPALVDNALQKESSARTQQCSSTEGVDAEETRSKKRARVQMQMPADMDAMRELLNSGEILKLPIPMMKDWLRKQGWTTGGKRDDLVERIRVITVAA